MPTIHKSFLIISPAGRTGNGKNVLYSVNFDFYGAEAQQIARGYIVICPVKASWIIPDDLASVNVPIYKQMPVTHLIPLKNGEMAKNNALVSVLNVCQIIYCFPVSHQNLRCGNPLL